MKFIDTHCHLNFDPMIGDIGGVLARSAAAGVSHVVVPAYDLASWPQIENLSQNSSVFGAYGLHPWVAGEPIDYSQLAHQLKKTGAIAVGEIGLDFKIDKPGRTRQIEVLTAQLDIAQKLNLPVILHCRGAFEELINIIESRFAAVRGVLHAYSRGPDLAARFLKLGLYLAFGGAVTRNRAERARRSAATIPLEKLLLETDAPSIGLDGVDPRDVEPRHVRAIGAQVAGLRNLSEQEIASITSQNARRLFGFD